MMKFWTIMAAVFLMTFSTAHARDSVLNIQEVTSANGLTAWLVEDHSVPVIALRFSFKKAGAARDPADKQGVSQLLSNTMDEGAGNLDSTAFQKELQDLSISLSFGSGRDNFGGDLKTLSKNKERAFDLLKLALTQPRFDEEPVGRMLESNLARVRRALADPSWLAARVMNDRAYEGHPYALNTGGTLSSLGSITQDDLRKAHRKLVRDNLVITASGDITADELGRVIDDVFGNLPQTAPADLPPEPQDLELKNTGSIFLYKKDILQTIVKILQPGIDRNDAEYYTGQVMNFILGSSGFGSRLTRSIREERGLTYGIYSGLQGMDHIDLLSVSTSTKNESVGEMLSLIAQEWQGMKTAPVSEKELRDAKSYLIGSLPLSLTSTGQIAGVMMGLRLDDLPIGYLDERAAKINAVTANDIQALAQKLLDEDSFVTVLVGQPDISTLPADTIMIETIPNAE